MGPRREEIEMQAVRMSNLELPDHRQRFSQISTAISDIFASSWRAASKDTDASASINLSASDGVILSHAKMSAFQLFNEANGDRRSLKFSAYICDQPQI